MPCMGGTFLEGIDPAALLLILVAVAVTTFLGVRTTLRSRRRFPRWLRSVMVRKRLDVIVRDLDRMAEYVGSLRDSDQAVWHPFELGLAAMSEHQWDQAVEQFQWAQANAGGTQYATLLNQLGICRYTQGRLRDALKEFQASARVAQQLGDKPGLASASNNIGVINRYCGELDIALKAFGDARALARESANETLDALCLGNIGRAQREKGELGPAQRSQEEALAIARRVGDEEGVASGLSSIASILRDRGQTDKALERYAEAVEIARKIGYKVGVVGMLGNIGGVYRDKREIDRALKSHESALALAFEIGYRPGVATEECNIGLILATRRMYERAVPYLAESLAFFLVAGVADGPRQALFGLSRCDDLLGRTRMRELLKKAGLSDEDTVDRLERIDQIRSQRPWQTDRLRHPFAPTA
jgi:tetratricopeptide (TPR) repeat protein